MRTISSSEFRRTYPTLRESVEVTSHGHIFGVWEPSRARPEEWTGPQPWTHGPVRRLEDVDELEAAARKTLTRPFTPAPKPSQR